MATTAAALVRNVNVVYLYVSGAWSARSPSTATCSASRSRATTTGEEASLGGTRFALHHAHEGIGALSAGTIHVNLEVEDVDERNRAAAGSTVSRWRRRCARSGAPPADVTDPDGYELYLFQPPPR